MNSQERAKRQSTDEWIEEFSTGQPVTPKQEQSAPYKPWIRDAPAEAVGNLQIIKQRTLAYDTHRTTSSNGHLILIFTDVNQRPKLSTCQRPKLSSLATFLGAAFMVFEAIRVIAGFQDVAMMGNAIQ